MSRSLRVKVTTLLVVMLLVPAAILAIRDVAEARARILESETALLVARADQLVGELDAFNGEYQRTAARLAQVPEVAGLLVVGADAAAVLARLALHVDGDDAVRGIVIVDASGRVRASTVPALVGADHGHRAHVADGVRGIAAISDPYLSDQGEPTIAYVAPVRGADRGVVGAVLCLVRAEALWRVARSSNELAGAGSFAVMLDRAGIRIAHTYSRDIVFHPAGALPPDALHRLVVERRFGDATRALLTDVRPFAVQFDRARTAQLDRRIIEGFAPVNQQVSYGVPRRLATAWWTVFYMVPKATLAAPIAILVRQRLLESFALAVAALAIGVASAALLVRPIRRLAAATSALAGGDLAVRVAAGQRDELGQLGQAFNAMAERLEHQAAEVRRSHDDLDLLVKRRTAELMTVERDAQRASAASEHKYRELYDSSPDMHLTADLITNEIVDCNQTLCDRLGYTQAELLGRPFLMVYHSNDRTAEVARFHEVGEFVDVERTLRCKDGRSIEVSLNLRGIRDPAGRLVFARAVWRDVTKRKQVERDRQFLLGLDETLRMSTDVNEVLEAVSSHLAGYLSATRCMFSEVDPARDEITIHRDYHGGQASLAGRLSLSAFGGLSAEAYARGVTVAIADTASDPRTAAAFERSYRSIAIRAVMTVPLLRDGQWVASLSVCARDVRTWEEREISLAKLIAERVWLWIEHLKALVSLRERDVTMAVQHTEARFRALVEGVRDYAIFMLDPDGNVATWNAGAERLQGYTAAEIVGHDFAVFSTPEERASGRPRSLLEHARRDGRFEEDGWRVRKDGTRFYANIVITSVRGRNGELDGFAWITRDITERRAQDEVLRAKQVALAQSLKEREVLLQEVHHRVKNNLQVISSLINMQVRKLEDPSTRDALEECQTRVLAIALIHEKLYQSKDYSQVRFSEYARSLAGNVFHAIGVSPHDVSLELAIDDVPLGVDRAIPCGLVINELITNSLKHGFRGGRSGTIRVALTALDDTRLRLAVEDDGVGLPDGFSIHAVESMGLQLVCTLAEQLDASVVVRGDGGASFQLTFARSA